MKLQGLDPSKRYKVKEINLMPNKKSNLGANEKTYSGDYLMKIGINAFTTNQAFSLSLIHISYTLEYHLATVLLHSPQMFQD